MNLYQWPPFLIANVGLLFLAFHLQLQSKSTPKTTPTTPTTPTAPSKSFLSAFSSHYNISSFQAIPTVRYTDTLRLQTLIHHTTQPFVLQDSPAHQWPALQKWTSPTYLQEHLPAVLHRVTTVRAGYPYIYAADSRPLAKLPSSQRAWWQHTRKDTVSFANFIARCNASTFYDYVQGWANDFETLANDLTVAGHGTNAWMHQNRATQWKTKQQVWCSCNKHSGSHVHHDHSHNVIVQLVGSKRFILTPPHQWNKFRDAPRISRFVSFSQRNFTAAAAAAAETAQDQAVQDQIQNSMDVTLNPGDVLYIPPFWWHHVVTTTSQLTIGTNLFTPDYRIQLKTLLGMPLPTLVHANKQGVAARHSATTLMISLLFEHVLLFKNKRKNFGRAEVLRRTQKFVQRIVMNRYAAALQGVKHVHLQNHCRTGMPLQCPKESWEATATIDAIPEEEIKDLFRHQIKMFQQWMTDDSVYSLPSMTAVEMMLSDYIEELVSYVVGPRNVCMFLRCLRGATTAQ